MWWGVPLTPSPDDARAQVRSELGKPAYQHVGSWIEQQIGKLVNAVLNSGNTLSADTGQVVAILIGLLVLAIALVLLARTRTSDRVAKRTSGTTLVDPTVTPAEYRALAERHLEAGEYDEAVVAAFRAIVSDLDRRTILGDRPARTAHEVSGVMARAFPGHADRIETGATWFDVAAYGISHGLEPRSTADQARRLLALGTDLQEARPVFEDVPAA